MPVVPVCRACEVDMVATETGGVAANPEVQLNQLVAAYWRQQATVVREHQKACAAAGFGIHSGDGGLTTSLQLIKPAVVDGFIALCEKEAEEQLEDVRSGLRQPRQASDPYRADIERRLLTALAGVFKGLKRTDEREPQIAKQNAVSARIDAAGMGIETDARNLFREGRSHFARRIGRLVASKRQDDNATGLVATGPPPAVVDQIPNALRPTILEVREVLIRRRDFWERQDASGKAANETIDARLESMRAGEKPTPTEPKPTDEVELLLHESSVWWQHPLVFKLITALEKYGRLGPAYLLRDTANVESWAPGISTNNRDERAALAKAIELTDDWLGTANPPSAIDSSPQVPDGSNPTKMTSSSTAISAPTSDELWPFSEEFRSLHTSLPKVPPSFFWLSNEFNEVNSPLIFEGTTTSLNQLHDSTAEPPYPLSHYPYLNDEFVCWLQLPNDVTGTQWYFGCVTFPRNEARKKLYSDFVALAAQAGARIRENPRFHEYLAPCMGYLAHADRFPRLHDGENVAWWLALLFTRPTIHRLMHAGITRHDIAEVARFQLDRDPDNPDAHWNPAKWSMNAIESWQLSGTPRWPIGRVVPPFRPIPRSETVAGEKQLDPSIAPPPRPEYLDLIVNKDRCEVTRRGDKYAHVQPIKLAGDVEWPLFQALYAKAGEELTTTDLHKLPGEPGKPRREAKRRLKDKLLPLGVTIPDGKWKLIDG